MSLNSAVLLQRWTRQHALMLCGAFALSLVIHSAVPITIVGFLSFLRLIVQHPNIICTNRTVPAWKIAANWATLLRVLLTVFVGLAYHLLSPYTITLIWLLIVVSDLLDGYLARRFEMSSLFGGLFDMEADAFFILVFAYVLYLAEYAAAWVLILGALRYLYVVALVLLKQQNKKEPRIPAARYVAASVMLAVAIPFVAPRSFYMPYLLFSTTCLLISFGHSFWFNTKRTPDS